MFQKSKVCGRTTEELDLSKIEQLVDAIKEFLNLVEAI